MAITNKEKGVWDVDQVYNKINEGGIWEFTEHYDMWAWGNASDWRLGAYPSPTSTHRSSPTQIGNSGTFSSTAWDLSKTHSNGDVWQQHMMVIKNGELWCWGGNDAGQLGQNNKTSGRSPTRVGTDSNWAAVGIGGKHTFATKTDGTLWGWGSNGFGLLGLNNRTSYSSPVQMMSDKTWSTSADNLTAGGDTTSSNTFSFLIDSSNQLWACGYNYDGNLGVNDRTHKSSPTQVPGTSWKMTTCGDGWANAMRTDGTLWGMGKSGSYGGGYSGGKKSSPTQLNGTNWATISGCWKNSAGVQTDGTLWAWGEGIYGSMGDNSTGNNGSPTQVGTDTTWSTTARPQHTYVTAAAIKSDGTLWAWGNNYFGQLGQNEGPGADGPGAYSSPVQIPGTSWARISSSGREAFIATSLQ
tara:strand:- start:60 stop:1292 length:1233 start_codon:yes stop_codon:yes gene_type:complete